MYTLFDVMLLIPLMLALWYWWHSSEQKTLAVAGAKAYCKQRNLQLLDDSLVFKQFRRERNLHQQRYWCRVYEFDYCPDGQSRQSGEIVLRGYQILRVILHSDVLEITQY
jgi:hypothetical protein